MRRADGLPGFGLTDMPAGERNNTATLLFFLGSFRWREHQIQDQEDRADGDGGVGYVEGGPAISAEPDFEEVGDGAVEDAIGDVAGGAAEQESETGTGCGSALAGDEQPRQSANHNERPADE